LGTASDLNNAVQQQGLPYLMFGFPTLPHPNSYSSFQDAKTICANHVTSPCRLSGSPYVIEDVEYVQGWENGEYGGKSVYWQGVHYDGNFDDDHWYGSWWQGDVEDKISSVKIRVRVSM
jgi:hypothetical protein